MNLKPPLKMLNLKFKILTEILNLEEPEKLYLHKRYSIIM